MTTTHPATTDLIAELHQRLDLLGEMLDETRRLLDLAAVPRPGDPLAAFRLPDGTVCYRTVPVGAVLPGHWFQRRHGDGGDWHEVERVVPSETSIGLAHDGNELTWFVRGEGRVRVACRPELLANRSESAELRAEARADRAEVAG